MGIQSCSSVDWESLDNAVLLNPKLPQNVLDDLHSQLRDCPPLERHVLMASSGTSGVLKLVALSKDALLASAEAVNKHLKSDGTDVWLSPLPEFHVGGLSIAARAYASGAHMHRCNFGDGRWNPSQFLSQVEGVEATLTSLVPTQLYDLVSLRADVPKSLRAVTIGGGALSEKLYRDAVVLGWKALPSYGLTECSSQVATAKVGCWNEEGFPMLHPLTHVELGVDAAGFLKIKSPALLSGYLEYRADTIGWIDPKADGWYTTEDRVDMDAGAIRAISRSSNFIKIGGESVDMLRLERVFEEVRLALQFEPDCALVPLCDERLGHSVHLAVACDRSDMCEELAAAFKVRVLPFEQIRGIHYIDAIPRSPLNKVLRKELQSVLSITRDL